MPISEIPAAVLELLRAHEGVLLAGAIVAGIADLWLANVFNELYYRTGLAVCKVTLPCRRARDLDRNALDATTVLPTWALKLGFGKIGPQEFAVSEPVYRSWRREGVSYTPVMHAILSVDPAGKEVRVVGRANWSILVLMLVFSTWVGWRFPEDASLKTAALWWFIRTVPFAGILMVYSLQVKIYRALVRAVSARLEEPPILVETR